MEIVFETLRLQYLTFTIRLLFKQQSKVLKCVEVVFVHPLYLKFGNFYNNYIYIVLYTFLSIAIWLTRSSENPSAANHLEMLAKI